MAKRGVSSCLLLFLLFLATTTDGVKGDISILPSEAGRHVVLAQSDAKGKWIALSEKLYPMTVTVFGESPQLAWFEAPPGVYAVVFIPLDDSQPIVKRVELGKPAPPPPPPPDVNVSLSVETPITEGSSGVGIAEHNGEGIQTIILSSDSQRLVVPKTVDAPPGIFKATAPDNDEVDGPATARIRAMLGARSAVFAVNIIDDDKEPEPEPDPEPEIPDDEFGNVGQLAYDTAIKTFNAEAKAVATKVGGIYLDAASFIDNGKLPTIESAAKWVTDNNQKIWGNDGISEQYKAWAKIIAQRWEDTDADADKWKVARFFRAVSNGLLAVE